MATDIFRGKEEFPGTVLQPDTMAADVNQCQIARPGIVEKIPDRLTHISRGEIG